MSYNVQLNRRAEKKYEALPPRLQKQLKKSLKELIDYLEGTASIPDIKKLHGKYNGIFRLRSGDYRLLFRLEAQGIRIIEILDIIHRQEGY
ncbi:MAG TPA: type II toxin-antitoxin system RelE/ParE family toxin [Thermotogota bacterium]|nr:type II toxin-antitoxin system RelE/ParE family toxin [Thermotogota bacterium]